MRGNVTKPSTGSVTGTFLASIAPFQDPQGFNVSTTITGVMTNRAPTMCKACVPTAANNNCTPACIPDATLLPGGQQVQLVTQQTLNAPAGTGRVYRLFITGSVSETNLTCTGFADLCMIRNVRQRCKPFNASGMSRDAMACGVFCRDARDCR